MNLDQAWQTFIAECDELLEEMESALLSLGQSAEDPDAINSIFRAAHTIKGSAGLFGLDDLVAFTHDLENVLDNVRANRLRIDDPLLQLLLSCRDHVALLVVHSHGSGDAADLLQLHVSGAPLTQALQNYVVSAEGSVEKKTTIPDAFGTENASAGIGFLTDSRGLSEAGNWHISLRFGEDVLRNGMDPLAFIRYLATMGEIIDVDTIFCRSPGAVHFAEVDPETCYLGFEIVFRTAHDRNDIESVFEFVRDECRICILPPQSKISEYLELINALPDEENARLGDILVRAGTLTDYELSSALAVQAAHPDAPLLGNLLLEERAVEPVVLAAALSKQKQARESKGQESRSVRVDSNKLDKLIDLVGELIISGAGINLIAQRSSDLALRESMSHFGSLVQDVRDSALQLRMVKIGATFKKFERVVHDVAHSLGKDIILRTAGEDTELDKTVIEKIGDPLTHLVRNAMDHGIESVDERLARGKAAQGIVHLNAYHEAGHIVIEVSDDGGGLRRDKILAKAIERGLVEPGTALTDQQVYELIFAPGFSTAEQVTNLSGRGVGMDVVKSNILALRGQVSIDSQEGRGTTVKVTLPLTLAIIDGFLVQVGESIFVLPLDAVEECIEFLPDPDRHHNYLGLRGQILPFARLREVFEIEGSHARRENVVVVRHGGYKMGLVVDKLLGEFQTVIKPLDKLFERNPLLSGSAILGSGQVALILNTAELIARLEQQEPEMA